MLKMGLSDDTSEKQSGSNVSVVEFRRQETLLKAGALQ